MAHEQFGSEADMRQTVDLLSADGKASLRRREPSGLRPGET